MAPMTAPRGPLGWLRALRGAAPHRAGTAAPDEAVIAASGLFDASLYLNEAPDVREAGDDPLAHFCRCGWREGRRPNFYFDPLWYRDRHLPGQDRNPLAHYVRTGEALGWRPVAYFDPGWYAHAYGLRRPVSALGHFLAHRRSQRFAPNPHFDLAFYLARHGAEIGPNRDPFTHLLRGGGSDLEPSPAFDSAAYRRDVMAVTPSAAGPTPWTTADLHVPLVHFLDAAYRIPAALDPSDFSAR
jgi:hypothetical protein